MMSTVGRIRFTSYKVSIAAKGDNTSRHNPAHFGRGVNLRLRPSVLNNVTNSLDRLFCFVSNTDVRFNFVCSLEQIIEGLERLKKWLSQ
ncbi:MAG: hypothetical protein ACYTBJ_13485 [Planctomycetota bacterium]